METTKRIKFLKNKYKDADIVVSVQGAIFNMKDYDLDSIFYVPGHNSFYIKDNEGTADKELFNCISEYAKIIS